MARIFVTGSADGLGRIAANKMADLGHRVVLHARSRQRADDALAAVPGAETALVADLASIEQTRALAEQANALGRFDAVIHNAALGYRESARAPTAQGVPRVLAVNTIAPYMLTALMQRPRRLIYMSSGLHRSGDASLRDLTWERRAWDGAQAYADSKLHDTILAFAMARRWTDVLCNAVDPGWVPTKMGGAGAPGNLEAGAATQVWLATSDDPEALVSGKLFHHKKPSAPARAALDPEAQDRLLRECARLSGVTFTD